MCVWDPDCEFDAGDLTQHTREHHPDLDSWLKGEAAKGPMTYEEIYVDR